MDEGHTIDFVYLNYAKAFNSVNRRFLQAKLESSVSMEMCLLGYHLVGHTRLLIDSVFSDESTCLSGVLPGSVIGPLLFCYIKASRLPISVIMLSFFQMTWKWCSRDLNQAAFAPLFLLHGPGQGSGAYKSTTISEHASLLGTSLPFYRLFLRQNTTTCILPTFSRQTWPGAPFFIYLI